MNKTRAPNKPQIFAGSNDRFGLKNNINKGYLVKIVIF